MLNIELLNEQDDHMTVLKVPGVTVEQDLIFLQNSIILVMFSSQQLLTK